MRPFCSNQNDDIKNFAVVMSVVVKRVDCSYKMLKISYFAIVLYLRYLTFLCPRDDSQGALRFALVCLSVHLSVRPSIRLSRFMV